MMAMKQVSLYTSNSAAVGAHQRSQNIVHCVSLDRQYSIVKARERSKFTYTNYCREKWDSLGRISRPTSGGHA